MLKRFSIKKISKYTVLLLVVFLFYLFPKNEEYTLEKTVSKEIQTKIHDIYLIDKNNYVSKTKIDVLSVDKENLIYELIEILKVDGKYIDKIPNDFSPIIPSDTKINGVYINQNIITIDFSKELLNVKKEYEEKLIESIIYTITSIDGIDSIIIKIDGQILKKLPKSGILLDEVLNRKYGINKIYDVQTIKDVSKVTVYYTSKTNDDNIYYVPITKYINSNKEKIKIIIDELTSKMSYESNLMSYLNYNAKLLDYTLEEDEIDLNFNEYLFDNTQNKKVLEEVIYSISYSIQDNYNVSKINFFVNNEEIR